MAPLECGLKNKYCVSLLRAPIQSCGRNCAVRDLSARLQRKSVKRDIIISFRTSLVERERGYEEHVTCER